MKTRNEDSKVYHIVTAAMMMCIIMVSVMLFRVPIPFTQGYVNLSDAMVFMAVIILGGRYGAIAAGMGSMLGDLMSGFAMWAPWSLAIKAVMAILFALIIQSAYAKPAGTRRAGESLRAAERRFLSLEIMGMIVSGLFMAAAYFFAEGIMYGNWAIALLGIPWNIAQFAVGGVLAVTLNAALGKTSLRSLMTYVQPMHM